MTITSTTTLEPGWVPEFDLADRLNRTLRETGVGVTDMAQQLGVGRETISRWINGHTKPKKAALIAWAALTGCDLDWLETGHSVVRHVGLEPTTRWFAALRPRLHLVRGDSGEHRAARIRPVLSTPTLRLVS